VSPARLFLIDRVPVPAWLHDIDELDVISNFGEQIEWGFAIPWIYQALAEPSANRPILQAPKRGDDFWPGALAYWSSLLHLLVYTFGWARPDRGLKWWYDTGKPTNDPKLALLSEVWDADGQLDWFAAWLWTSGNRGYLNRPIDTSDEPRVAVDAQWLRRVERSIEDSETPAPYGGGSDPFHLTVHIDGPMQPTRPAANWSMPDADGHTAILSLDSMTGWYSALLEAGTRLLGSGPEPVSVEVFVHPVGSLGTFRRSPATGLRYSGHHSVHLAGN
jgi:hypothetical protein